MPARAARASEGHLKEHRRRRDRDREGRVSFINPTAENLTGWKSPETAGKPLDEVFKIVSEDSRETVESPFAAVVREGLTVGLANHTLLLAKDGAEIPIDDSGAPIRDEKGRIVGAIIVFHDVSERRRAEIEREELLKSERAARRREAELAGRLKDEFLATVSHELRTPLSAILGWATMLKNKQLKGGDGPKALEIIERNAKAQGEIINDLLDVSQLATGKLTIDRQLVDVGAIIRSTAETLRARAKAKAIALTLAMKEDRFFVRGDATRLRQVILNLTANAVKFTPEGGSVELRAARREEDVEIIVSDSGSGSDEKFLPYIFDKFRQGDGSPTRRHGGLGLGLSIVRHLVALHDGEISAASRGPGKGAVFTIRLPLALKAEEEQKSGGAAAKRRFFLVDEPERPDSRFGITNKKFVSATPRLLFAPSFSPRGNQIKTSLHQDRYVRRKRRCRQSARENQSK